MTDDQLLLASAYLDDDVDDAARARAEADPEVMAEIAHLRAVRAALRDVGEPGAARREQAIAAALAAFADEAPAPVAAPVAVPPPARPGRNWWGAALVAAAAALVVIVAAGVVALRGAGGQDHDDSAASVTAAAEREEATMAASEATSSADAALPAPQAGESETDSGGAPAATEATAEAGADTQLAASLPVLTTPAELAAFAASAEDAAATAPRAPGDAATCNHPGTFVGLARYGDEVVEVFDDGGVVSALSATSCAVVATAEP